MKIRNGFVSNSSSSSFIIRNEDITQEQCYLIMSHHLTEGETKWIIKQDFGFMVGQTTACIYNMEKYLKKIGVIKNKILWVHT